LITISNDLVSITVGNELIKACLSPSAMISSWAVDPAVTEEEPSSDNSSLQYRSGIFGTDNFR
jgi:hypothetical protein